MEVDPILAPIVAVSDQLEPLAEPIDSARQPQSVDDVDGGELQKYCRHRRHAL
jgi:hypothetical protein